MKRKGTAVEANGAELPMTSIIDVVLLLLVYFLVTAAPTDVLAHLGAAKGGGSGALAPLLRTQVRADGYALNGTPAPLDALDGVLRKLAAVDPAQTVAIACEAASEHARLEGVLNLCERHGLTRLSVASCR